MYDNVLVGAFLHDANSAKARATAEHSIRICGLAEFAGKTSGELPIGVKKRLELARALATRPRLLMLDEVMAGLTSTEVNTALELIRNIRKEGVTLLIVEHIMEAIMPIADKVVGARRRHQARRGPPRRDHPRPARHHRLPGREVQPPHAGPEGGRRQWLSRS